jgi:hypothetical protein
VKKTIATTLLLAALGVAASAQQADAAVFGFPKSLKTSPFGGIEMNFRRPEPIAMFDWPRSLKDVLDRMPQDVPAIESFLSGINPDVCYV